MKEFEVIKQALDKATSAGVFNLQEVSIIINAVIALEGTFSKEGDTLDKSPVRKVK